MNEKDNSPTKTKKALIAKKIPAAITGRGFLGAGGVTYT
jgi:hypothetical protein